MKMDIKHSQREEKQEMSIEQLDMIIESIRKAPICCRCGSGVNAAPYLQTIKCPGCGNHMRHVGGMWMQYVSPLDLSTAAPAPPTGGNRRDRFTFTK